LRASGYSPELGGGLSVLSGASVNLQLSRGGQAILLALPFEQGLPIRLFIPTLHFPYVSIGKYLVLPFH